MLKLNVLKHFGGPKNTADALDINPASVSQWGDVIPEKQALKLDHLTNGKLKYDSRLYIKVA